MKSALFLLLGLLGIDAALGRPITYQPAVSIIGQPNFTSEIPAVPASASNFYNPDGVAIDPTTGKLFVSDTTNNRILRFSATAAYQTNPEAEAVFGQPDFTSDGTNRGNGEGNPSADSLDRPANLCFDSAGNLYVADYGNARVLRFDAASSKPATAATADAVIGQPDANSAGAASNSISDSGFVQPTGVAVDGTGRLWVSDSMIPRVLGFDNAATINGDVAADAWFGETEGESGMVDMDTFDSETVNASSFGSDLWGLSVDANGHLWVADASNNRVLLFLNAASKANGADADKVFGHADFTSSTAESPPTASSMDGPYYVTAAPDGTLWVSDYTNYRVLGFVNALGKTSGAPADIVLGQPDFVTKDSAGPYTSRKTTNPSQSAIGRGGSLFVGEYSNAGHIKRWSDPVAVSTPRTLTTKRPTATLRGRSAGAIRVQYKVTGQGGFKTARGPAANWNARLTKLKKKTTPVTVRATAFDNRSASGLTRVKLKVPKPK